MATSGITKNFVISGREQMEMFVNVSLLPFVLTLLSVGNFTNRSLTPERGCDTMILPNRNMGGVI